jgi:hypothetical protein
MLLEGLQSSHPERFADTVFRTLHRDASQWGAGHEIDFVREPLTGRSRMSDVVVIDELDINRGGLASLISATLCWRSCLEFARFSSS